MTTASLRADERAIDDGGQLQQQAGGISAMKPTSRSWPVRLAYLQLSPGLLLVTAALLVPLCLLVVASFWSAQGYGEFDTTFTLANYEKLLERPGYSRILLRSIGIAGCVTLVTIVLAYPLAYFVAFDVSKRKL
ncbi:MAG: hypothetical protein RIA65_14230, partial [Woeseia sp.]